MIPVFRAVAVRVLTPQLTDYFQLLWPSANGTSLAPLRPQQTRPLARGFVSAPLCQDYYF